MWTASPFRWSVSPDGLRYEYGPGRPGLLEMIPTDKRGQAPVISRSLPPFSETGKKVMENVGISALH